MPGWLWPPRSRPCRCGLARRGRAAVAPNGGTTSRRIGVVATDVEADSVTNLPLRESLGASNTVLE
eukprot:2996511-Pleurochrysis_carterae.AAC.1